MKTFLSENKADLIRRAEWITQQTDDYQTIKAYMNARMGDISLNNRQQHKLERWQFIYNQLSTGKYTEQEVRQQLMKHFGTPENTSYTDMREAKELMSTTINLNKRFKIQVDIELLDLMKLKARESNNLDAYAKLQKVQNELYKMIPDEEEKPIDHFTPRQNIVQYNPALLGIAPIPEAQMKDLVDQLKREYNIEDVEYTMIEANDADSGTL